MRPKPRAKGSVTIWDFCCPVWTPSLTKKNANQPRGSHGSAPMLIGGQGGFPFSILLSRKKKVRGMHSLGPLVRVLGGPTEGPSIRQLPDILGVLPYTSVSASLSLTPD